VGVQLRNLRPQSRPMLIVFRLAERTRRQRVVFALQLLHLTSQGVMFIVKI
jgi:hypothetical protein